MDFEREIHQLEAVSQSASAIAALRRQLLLGEESTEEGDSTSSSSNHTSLPAWFQVLFQTVVQDFLQCVRQQQSHSAGLLLADWPATSRLARVLQIHDAFSRLDPTLSQELGRQGTHGSLIKVIHCELEEHLLSSDMEEANQDALMELQDAACGIAALYEGSFPMRAAPMTLDELRQRLPLVFDIEPVYGAETAVLQSELPSVSESLSILIHQVTKQRQSEQKDVGFVMWPSAVVLARWLATNPHVLQSNSSSSSSSILEVGAGCGLTGLFAAKLLQSSNSNNNTPSSSSNTNSSRVLLTDFNPHVLENLNHNIHLNQVQNTCTTKGLDFYQHVPDENSSTPNTEQLPTNSIDIRHSDHHHGWWDMEGNRQDPVNIILGADIICQPSDAVAASHTIHQALRPGGRAYIVCATSKHRFGVDIFPTECHKRGLRVSMENVADLYKGALLLDGLEKTTGYVEGMELTMFTLEKSHTERDI